MRTKANRYRAPVAWLREVLRSFRVRRVGQRGNVIELRAGILETPTATITVELMSPMALTGAETDLREISIAVENAIRRAGR